MNKHFSMFFHPTGHIGKIWPLKMDENWVISKMAAISRDNL